MQLISARSLTAGLIDYAGLFAPAALDMQDAIEAYARHLQSADRYMLGRFVVPATRLAELSDAAKALRVNSDEEWTLSALVGENYESELRAVAAFNQKNDSAKFRAVVDTLELKAASARMVNDFAAKVGDFYRVFVESSRPGGREQDKLLNVLRDEGYAAKIRTGGVTEDAFPGARDIVKFMSDCLERSIPFKATAGLHHLLRGEYPLTYESGSRTAPMFGYLNIAVAAVFLFSGSPDEHVENILLEEEPGAFRFAPNLLEWRELTVSASEIRAARERFFGSLGSCSFTEPVEELHSFMNSASVA